MARKCTVTGKGTHFGNAVSHSHLKTRRTWKVNVITRKIFLEDENRWVKVKISTRALRTLNKKGIKAAIQDHGGEIKGLAPKKYVGLTPKLATVAEKK